MLFRTSVFGAFLLRTSKFAYIILLYLLLYFLWCKRPLVPLLAVTSRWGGFVTRAYLWCWVFPKCFGTGQPNWLVEPYFILASAILS
ncbi:hypothetical protein [Pontibacter mucosus]|uniref:hypothetical protein n=1 Tax=Pontibacter mucosus TaxID=1649266 RepID=UPI0011B248FC|nr:hypothetical protein [Pontibacter mucosus]